MSIDDLIAAARNGSQRAAGRLLSLIEGDRRDEVLAGIEDWSRRANRRRSPGWSAPTGSAEPGWRC